MRIVQITPGSGGTFYCENCLRDAALVRAMRSAGHDVLMVPLYLPISGEDTKLTSAPVFFGGINVFLQQKLRLFRRTPEWLDRMFDSPRLLRWAARQAGATSARDLAETTISMLRGEEGRQVKELDRLTTWLKDNAMPDLVCLSNALLLGLARRIKDSLGCPVACMLQDEDIFVDALGEEWANRAWDTIATRASDADGFIAVSEYYKNAMIDRLGLDGESVIVAHPGLDFEGYPDMSRPAAPTIGFMERLCHAKGFDILVDAFTILKSERRFADVRLKATGGSTPEDKEFIADGRRRLEQAGVAEHVEIVEDFDRPSRIGFLSELSVLAVPSRHKEAFGLYAIEAMAAGVPVVLPDHGVASELVGMTGGGLTHTPHDSRSLAEAIATVLSDEQRARMMGESGRDAALGHFSVERAAERFIEACESIASTNAGGRN